MKVRDLMTANPASCRPETPLAEVARTMADRDCGCLPVLEGHGTPIGVITDRDIVLRAVAQDRDVRALTAADCMSGNVITVEPEMSAERCCEVMEQSQIRRAVVIDAQGHCCGMVAQADVALHDRALVAEVVEAVSRPDASAQLRH
jgi:CBS domain-containing protein